MKISSIPLIGLIVLVLLAAGAIVMPAAYSDPLPDHYHIYINVSNDAGVKYDLNGNNTYFISMTNQSGGLNPLHISTDYTVPNGQVTTTHDQSGTFYATFTGGIGHMDDGVLMLAVNGTIPDDFSVNIQASGYNWTPATPAYTNPPNPTVYNYQDVSLDETFNKSDFIYGPQIWKICGQANYPIYHGQDMSNSSNTFQLMFIDLRAGAFYNNASLIHNGAIQINYSFHNLTTFAAFDDYGWFSACNWGPGIPMTNNIDNNGYAVIGVPAASFTADPTSGSAPLTVQFTDTSSNSPTSWDWNFGDGSADSYVQNPQHIFDNTGLYTVTLTASNAGGSSAPATMDIEAD